MYAPNKGTKIILYISEIEFVLLMTVLKIVRYHCTYWQHCCFQNQLKQAGCIVPGQQAEATAGYNTILHSIARCALRRAALLSCMAHSSYRALRAHEMVKSDSLKWVELD